MIGYKNYALERVGVSKYRLMLWPKFCVVCSTELSTGEIHRCAEHANWEVMVVDSQITGAQDRAALTEDPSAPPSTS